jgi:hypothetical protein
MTSKHENANSPAIGVDIGTSRIVAAQRKGDGFQYSTQLNAYVAVPFSKLTVSVLEKEKIPHAVEGGWIRVHGNESEAFADLMNGEIRRPMTNGVLDAKDPESLATLERILASLIGEANGTRTVCFSVPAAPLGAQDGVTYHEATVRQILGGLGFQAKSINEGMAVIYAELAHTNYTGIGVSCGAGHCTTDRGRHLHELIVERRNGGPFCAACVSTFGMDRLDGSFNLKSSWSLHLSSCGELAFGFVYHRHEPVVRVLLR